MSDSRGDKMGLRSDLTSVSPLTWPPFSLWGFLSGRKVSLENKFVSQHQLRTGAKPPASQFIWGSLMSLSS